MTKNPKETDDNQKQTKATENKKDNSPKADPKLQKIIDEVGGLSVLELSELVKALEDQFGVEAIAAPIATAGAVSGNGADDQQNATEEKKTATITMTAAGANKINVIKALREINPDLGLTEAKDMTEQLPAKILEEAKIEDAQTAKKKLEEAGAQVELK